MAKVPEDGDRQDQSGEVWYLRKNDGSEFGPEPLRVIARWAAESRVVSGNALSRDRKAWIPVQDVPELGMVWTAELPDGRRYGPFNIDATRDLVAHKVLPLEAQLENLRTEEAITVKDYLENGLPLEAEAKPEAAEEDPVRSEETPETAVKQESPTGRENGKTVAGADDETPSPDDETPSPDDATPAERNPKPAKKTRRRKKPDSKAKKDKSGQTELWAMTEDAAPDTPQAPDEAPVTEDAAAVSPQVADETPVTADAGDSTDGEPSAPGEAVDENVAETTAPPTDDNDAAETHELLKKITALETKLEETEQGIADATQAFVQEQARAEQVIDESRQRDAELNRKIAALEAEMAEERERFETVVAEKEDAEAALTRKVDDAEARLKTVLAEIKELRRDDETVKESPSEVQDPLQRRSAIQTKGLKEVLSERNTLASFVEAEATRGGSRFKLGLAVLASLSLVVGISLLIRFGCRRHVTTPAVGTPAVEAASPTRGKASAETPARTTPARPPLLGGGPGVEVFYERDGCSVVFEAGTFESGTKVAARVQPIVAKLAPQIRPYLDTYDLVIVGHTDDQPVGAGSRYRSNDDLARDRARAFARYLAKEGGLPMASMRAVPAGDEHAPPYPNADPASRPRNRTVVLKLVRRHASR